MKAARVWLCRPAHGVHPRSLGKTELQADDEKVAGGPPRRREARRASGVDRRHAGHRRVPGRHRRRFPHGGGASLATLATLGSDAPPGTLVLPGGRPR